AKVEASPWFIVTVSPVEIVRLIGVLNWSSPTAVVPGGRKIVRRVNSPTVDERKSLLPFCPIAIDGTLAAPWKKTPSSSRKPKPSGTFGVDSKSMMFRFCEAALKEARSRKTAASARPSEKQQTRTNTAPERNHFKVGGNIDMLRTGGLCPKNLLLDFFSVHPLCSLCLCGCFD